MTNDNCGVYLERFTDKIPLVEGWHPQGDRVESQKCLA